IERANRYGSYGNYVRIKHPRGYKTAYAHLSRFAKNMKAGKRVRQGQVIGYVGATGRVTGAHLHYEVYKGAKRVNPMRLDLPTGEVLSGAALAAFRQHKTATDAMLDTHLSAQAASASTIAPAAGQ
ncbi:MAG: M23 family metallopeptidase, partial [Pseudomonadota bacterium]